MTVETLKTLSLASFAISGVFFLITIWIFIKFDVMGIIGELTGVTRKRAIKDIRNQSSEEQSGFYNPSYARGKNTEHTGKGDSRKLSGHLRKGNGASGKLDAQSGKIGGASGKLDARSGKLDGASEKLQENIGQEDQPTSVLIDNDSGQTVVLDVSMLEESMRVPTRVEVVTEIILCDTEEVIA